MVHQGNEDKHNKTSNIIMPPKKRAIKPSADAAEKQASYKRRRIADQDYSRHAFLDASATVHAGLFAARRLPEIKSLWRGLVDGQLQKLDGNAKFDLTGKHVRRSGQSGGGKISSRHLRRRTGSHQPRRRHRFPRGDFIKPSTDGNTKSVKSDNVTNAEDVSVQTTSKIQAGRFTKQSSYLQQNEPRCRRWRRKPALLQVSHSAWWQSFQIYPNRSDTTSTHKWIPTHFWHAKRFHVANLFGWGVPLVHCNRGCRASLRLAVEKCTVQDASWEIDGCALVLTVRKSNTEKTNPPLVQVVQMLKRLCGVDSLLLKDPDVLAGKEIREGFIYKVDSFPMRLIGPASFLFRDDSEAASVSIMVHPNIRLKVQSLLESVILDSKCFDASITAMPLSLLRVRGIKSLPTIAAAFSIDTSKLVQRVGRNSDQIDGKTLRHGVVMCFDEVGTVTADALESRKSLDKNHFDHVISTCSPCKILIKSHQPNGHLFERELPHNTACSGFDVVCHPSLALQLFQSLVMNDACAIGLTEDARAQLEAFPPLHVFPRDYPDTEDGISYWQVSHNAVECKNMTWVDWSIVRTCYEAPWGRINGCLKTVLRQYMHLKNSTSVKHPIQQYDSLSKVGEEPNGTQYSLVESVKSLGKTTNVVRWECLLSPSHKNDATIVVARGSSCHPFLSALNGYGKFSKPSKSSNKHKHRRPFRSVIKASPLSKQELEAHFDLCQNLLNSPSLPSLLRCEVCCDGKGTLLPGDLMFPLITKNDNSNKDATKDKGSIDPLGVVTCGGYSRTRGTCHGVGFISAARVIGSLMDGSVDGMGIKQPQLNGSSKMMLKVHLRKLAADCVGRYAMITILL